MEYLAKMIDCCLWDWLGRFVLILIGAYISQVLFLEKNSMKSLEYVLKKFFPKRDETFRFRVEFVVVPILGSIVILFVIKPADIQASFISGLTWWSTVQALVPAKDKNKPEDA